MTEALATGVDRFVRECAGGQRSATGQARSRHDYRTPKSGISARRGHEAASASEKRDGLGGQAMLGPGSDEDPTSGLALTSRTKVNGSKTTSPCTTADATSLKR
jgi:hypothetical protein